MKDIENGENKLKKICDILKTETLEPAQKQANQIIFEAKEKAALMIEEAEKKVKQIQLEQEQTSKKNQLAFENSLIHATKQCIESIKSMIEKKLFKSHLDEILSPSLTSSDVLAKLINAIVEAVQKEGVHADLSVYVPSVVSSSEVNNLLLGHVINALKEKSVLLSSLHGGVELKIHDQHLTLDLTDQYIKEIISQYIRKDFRTLLFAI
ncbi:MAG: V-type ATP synthase subunit E [Rhabdochlamydiaceae bacterium]